MRILLLNQFYVPDTAPLDTLLNLPHVKDLHTSFSLGEVKAGAALPLTHLRSARP